MANTNTTNKEKKAEVKTPAKNKDKSEKGGFISFLRGVRQELKKVVWPTKEELTTDTVVVIVCVAFFAIMFWLVDTGFLAALKGILGVTLS